MPETNTSHELQLVQPHSGELTPEVAMQLNDYVDSQGFYLRGHGTPIQDHQLFFDEGIFITDGYMTRYDDLGNISIPLAVTDPEHPDSGQQITNIGFMKNWPHKKYTAQPNVVLMAVPYGESNITATTVNENMLDSDEEDTFPPSLIAGFFNAESGQIIMNPDFNINHEVRASLLQKVAERHEARSVRLDDVGNELHEPMPSINLESSYDNDADSSDWV